MKADLNIPFGKHIVSSKKFTVIAGPCSIESEKQFLTISKTVRDLGAQALRGGVYKMRTSKDSFQGLGEKAFPIIDLVKKECGLPFVSEVVDTRHVETLSPFVDVFQVGTRNMYNYHLLKELASTKKTVILKRGFSATIKEWVLASQYLKEHHENIIFCERGIRTFETQMRNTFDINAVSYFNKNIDQPIFADPSHGTGDKDLVTPIALAAVMAGADGIIIEVHNEPEKALSDKFQALDFKQFEILMKKIEKLLPLVDKTL